MANPSPGLAKNPNHIALDVGTGTVTVSLGDAPVASSASAVVLREGRMPPRAYLPKADIAATLSPTRRTTHCPYKGDTVYYDVTAGGTTLNDAAWSYDTPYDEMAPIAGLVAFDDRFKVTLP